MWGEGGWGVWERGGEEREALSHSHVKLSDNFDFVIITTRKEKKKKKKGGGGGGGKKKERKKKEEEKRKKKEKKREIKTHKRFYN